MNKYLPFSFADLFTSSIKHCMLLKLFYYCVTQTKIRYEHMRYFIVTITNQPDSTVAL